MQSQSSAPRQLPPTQPQPPQAKVKLVKDPLGVTVTLLTDPRREATQPLPKEMEGKPLEVQLLWWNNPRRLQVRVRVRERIATQPLPIHMLTQPLQVLTQPEKLSGLKQVPVTLPTSAPEVAVPTSGSTVTVPLSDIATSRKRKADTSDLNTDPDTDTESDDEPAEMKV